MPTNLLGVSASPILLPEGRGQSTSIVPVRSATAAQGVAIAGDYVDWGPRRTQGQRAARPTGYTRTRPFTAVDDEDAADVQRYLSSPELFCSYDTYGSAASVYQFYANLFSLQYYRSIDIYV